MNSVVDVAGRVVAQQKQRNRPPYGNNPLSTQHGTNS